jgi:hypothetical protein
MMLLTIHVGCVNLERNEYVGWGDLVFLCEAEDDAILQEGRLVRAERRIGRDDNTSFVARSKDVFFETRPNASEDISSLNGSFLKEFGHTDDARLGSRQELLRWRA